MGKKLKKLYSVVSDAFSNHLGKWYFKIGERYIGMVRLRAEEEPKIPRPSRSTREINLDLDTRIAILEQTLKSAHHKVDILDVEKIPYRKGRKDTWRCLRLMVYAQRQEFPRQYLMQMFAAYPSIDDQFPGATYGHDLMQKLMIEIDQGRMDVENAYNLTKYIQTLGALNQKGSKDHFLKWFTGDKIKINNPKLLGNARRRVAQYRMYAGALDQNEKEILANRDKLYDNSWDRYSNALKLKLEDPPDIAHLAGGLEAIKDEINTVNKLREIESKKGINLSDYLPLIDPVVKF